MRPCSPKPVMWKTSCRSSSASSKFFESLLPTFPDTSCCLLYFLFLFDLLPVFAHFASCLCVYSALPTQEVWKSRLSDLEAKYTITDKDLLIRSSLVLTAVIVLFFVSNAVTEIHFELGT